MKQHPHKRASLEFVSSPTYAAPVAVTVTRSHDATITAKPELKKRSGGKLSDTDPRFIGYDMLFGESVSTLIEHTCNTGYTLSTSGGYYSCCPISTNLCSFATNCIGSSYELFDGGVTSRCASYCVTGAIYTATNDKAPLFHVGCGAENYKALRNGDTDLLNAWSPAAITPWPTIGYTGTYNPADATPYPGELLDPVTESVWGPGTSYEITYHFTKLSGAIVGGVILVGLIICCIWGRRKRRREERRRLVPRPPLPSPGPGNFYPQLPNPSNTFPKPALARYMEEQELVPMPPMDPPRPREYLVPAYQICMPQAQRAGYEHVLRDESHETSDSEALLPGPPPYVEPTEELVGAERHEHEMV